MRSATKRAQGWWRPGRLPFPPWSGRYPGRRSRPTGRRWSRTTGRRKFFAASESVVRSVAKRLSLGLLAAAEPHGLAGRRLVLHRHERGGLVAAIAEGLALRLPAGAPPV